ncbi:MAG: metallophosphoesterase [Candidatus Marinimicrobia bacterium]|nr:metallophosphoesterase [Candidatus Neomarinimicrobiota bacterium]
MQRSLFHLVIFALFVMSMLGMQWSLYKRSLTFMAELGMNSQLERRMIGVTRFFFLYLVSAGLISVILGFDSSGSAIIKYMIFYPLIIWLISSFVTFLFIMIKEITVSIIAVSRKYIPYFPKIKVRREINFADRRKFLQSGSLVSLGIAAAPVTTFGYGAIAAKLTPELNEVNIDIHGLPDALQGLKIAQVSDLHTNQFIGESEVERVTGLVMRENPDIIIITGDFVSNSQKYIPICTSGLRGLSAPGGVFGCLGNHDYYTGAAEVRNQMESIGVNILVNSSAVVEVKGEKITIAGIDDLWVGKPDLDSTLRDADKELPLILMSHNPDIFPLSAKYDVDLTLSGHTHGGQVGLKFLGNNYSFVHLVTPFVSGEFKIGSSKLYVNRGIGTVGPPIRLNSTPEITLFSLGRDND